MPNWVSKWAIVSKASAPGERIEKFGQAWEASGVREKPPARSKRSRAWSQFLKARIYKRMNMIPSKTTLLTFAASLTLVIGGCSGIKGGTTSGRTRGGVGGRDAAPHPQAHERGAGAALVVRQNTNQPASPLT